MREVINRIEYEFITVEWIEEQLRLINIENKEGWVEQTNEAYDKYIHNFALLIYNLFKRGLGLVQSVNGTYALAGFDFNRSEINEGKSFNKTDLDTCKARLLKMINDLSENFALLATSVQSMQGAMTALASLVNELSVEVATLTEEVETLTTTIGTLTGQIETLNNNALSNLPAYDLGGFLMPLPTECGGGRFTLKYGCKDDAVIAYWQLDS